MTGRQPAPTDRLAHSRCRLSADAPALKGAEANTAPGLRRDVREAEKLLVEAADAPEPCPPDRRLDGPGAMHYGRGTRTIQAWRCWGRGSGAWPSAPDDARDRRFGKRLAAGSPDPLTSAPDATHGPARPIDRHAEFRGATAIQIRKRNHHLRGTGQRISQTAAALRRPEGEARQTGSPSWQGNDPELLVLLFACARLGAIFVPLNPAGCEHRHVVHDCGLPGCSSPGTSFTPIANQFRADLPGTRFVSLGGEALMGGTDGAVWWPARIRGATEGRQ